MLITKKCARSAKGGGGKRSYVCDNGLDSIRTSDQDAYLAASEKGCCIGQVVKLVDNPEAEAI